MKMFYINRTGDAINIDDISYVYWKKEIEEEKYSVWAKMKNMKGVFRLIDMFHTIKDCVEFIEYLCGTQNLNITDFEKMQNIKESMKRKQIL
jgi:hypothetical protein